MSGLSVILALPTVLLVEPSLKGTTNALVDARPHPCPLEHFHTAHMRIYTDLRAQFMASDVYTYYASNADLRAIIPPAHVCSAPHGSQALNMIIIQGPSDTFRRCSADACVETPNFDELESAFCTRQPAAGGRELHACPSGLPVYV